MDSEGTYQLRAELIGHQEDVRCIATAGEEVITGSRDRTVRVWKDSDTGFVDDSVLVGHSDFVSTVAGVPPDRLPQCSEVSIVSGSRDSTVILWDVDKGEAVATLKGHKYQVSCVAVGRNKEIISGSHDGTVRVYSGDSFENVEVLSDHKGPVQCVLVLDSGEILTGSNDNTVKLWTNLKCSRTFVGHTDTVRALALLSEIGVISASHDMTLKLWDFQGSIASEFLGHTAIIYSVATSPSGLVASASEDNTARVWQPSGECIASIQHPGCVWGVAFLPNNDLVTGCSDSTARVWTTDSARVAPAEALQALQERIAARAQSGHGVSSSNSQLPAGLNLEDSSVLQQPGNKDGQIKVINEGGIGMAYSWNNNLENWEKIGQVTGGEGGDMQAGRSDLDGQSYDHVINVDIDDNRPPLKLGINQNDNPYDVADRFIEQHGLSPGYREQIVQFITQNTGVRIPVDLSMNHDPFTGSGAYIPTPSTVSPYQPSHNSLTGGGVDPFTGGSRSQPAPAGPTPGSHIPATTMIIFDNPLSQAPVGQKIRSFSASLAQSLGYSAMALTEAEAAQNGTLDRLLASASAAPRSGADPLPDELALLKKLLHWPRDNVFPAFDIARLAIFNDTVAHRLAANAGPVGASASGTLGAAVATAVSENEAGEAASAANQQTVLRFLCNSFRSPQLRAWISSNAAELIDVAHRTLKSPPKPVRAAAAAFALNLAIQARHDGFSESICTKISSLLIALLPILESQDEEAKYRSILALGTLLSTPNGRTVFTSEGQAQWSQTLQSWSSSNSPRLSEVVKEIIQRQQQQ